MVPHDANAGPAGLVPDVPAAALLDARQRFLASFPKRSDSIGLLLGTAATVGAGAPVLPLRQAVHRMCGLAGMLGFPTAAVGLTLGADDCLVKPVDMAELMRRIQVLLARQR